ncbi:MAG: glycosyltransferase [Solirubrobacteraceae bacterium]
MQRIVFLLPELAGGGAERACAMLASSLPRERFEPLLLLQHRTVRQYPVASHVQVLELGIDNPGRALIPLRRTLGKLAPAAVYAALPHLNAMAVAAAWTMSRRPRVIVSVHNNTALEYADLGKRWLRIGEPLTYALADAVVCVSQGVADTLRTLTPHGQNKVRVIPNPVDVAEIARSSRQVSDHPWFQGEHRVVLAAGRLVPQKDYPMLLRAFTLVHATCPDARLLILGEGPLRQQLSSEVKELGLSGLVEMPGRVDNPYPYFAAAACLAQASRYEGFGMALVEAQAASCPVAATDCPYGPAEVLDHGRLGLLSAVGDPAGFAGNVVRLLDDPALAAQLREEGLVAARNYAPEKVAASLADLLSGLCDI